jgi:hypothetical protein
MAAAFYPPLIVSMAMSYERRHFAQRFRWLAVLRGSLVAGAAYDLGFAALMVAAPEVPSQVFRLPLPGAAFYLWFMAILLAMLAGMYLLAAKDPRRYSGVIAVAIFGRAVGAVAFAAAAWFHPEWSGLYPLAAGDFAFALVHAVSWLPLRS